MLSTNPDAHVVFYRPEISTLLDMMDGTDSEETTLNRLKISTAISTNVKLIDGFSFINFKKLPRVFTKNINKAIQFLQLMVENGQLAEDAKAVCDSKRNKLVIYNIQLADDLSETTFVSILGVIKNLEDKNEIKDRTSKPFQVFATSDGRIVNDSCYLEASGYYEPSEDRLPKQYGKYLEVTPVTTKYEAVRIESHSNPSI